MPGTPTVELLSALDAEAAQRRAAGALLAAGCEPGDRVAFCLSSSAALLCAVLGAARRGIIPVMLNATLTTGERDALAADARPRLKIFTEATLAALDDGPPAELSRYPLTRPMHYTSGTTGRAKGVTSGVWDEATAAAVFEDEADVWGMRPDDRHLVCSPMYHTVSVRFAASTLLRGGSLILLSRFDAATAVGALREHAPTTAFLVPTHLHRVLALPGLGADERFASLRLLAHAGEPCPPVVKRAAMGRVNPGVLYEFYGATEGQFTVCGPDEWLERPGTVGRARPGRRLFIEAAPLLEPLENGVPDDGVPDDGVPDDGVPDDGAPRAAVGGDQVSPTVGTIWCDAPAFARFSYWGNERATKAAWRGSAFSVGDLGHLDEDGYLYLSGRRDDLIISGGVNVYPAEVEAVLAEVAGVAEVAVFGLSDPEWGQRVCAAVVGPASLDLDALRAAAALHLAPYKRPKQYLRAPDLPHTATGKLVRRLVPEHLGLADR